VQPVRETQVRTLTVEAGSEDQSLNGCMERHSRRIPYPQKVSRSCKQTRWTTWPWHLSSTTTPWKRVVWKFTRWPVRPLYPYCTKYTERLCLAREIPLIELPTECNHPRNQTWHEPRVASPPVSPSPAVSTPSTEVTSPLDANPTRPRFRGHSRNLSDLSSPTLSDISDTARPTHARQFSYISMPISEEGRPVLREHSRSYSGATAIAAAEEHGEEEDVPENHVQAHNGGHAHDTSRQSS
jgi:hypothetical protein